MPPWSGIGPTVTTPAPLLTGDKEVIAKLTVKDILVIALATHTGMAADLRESAQLMSEARKTTGPPSPF